MKKTIISLAFMSIAVSAAAQSATESTGVNSALGVAPKTEDFVLEVSASDLFEIESSRLALTKGDASIKAFAQQMINEHEKTSAELKALVSGGKIQAKPTAALTDDHKEQVDDLAKLDGAQFSEGYVDDQIDAHEDAVDLFKRYADGGDNAELKAWAAKTLPALQHHLEMARGLDK
ncbi:DUF4142 domain-containing protein [Agrobacterium fabrum]|uniref:DUF4142 domain-containing protein n=1 Tax=Agrobacterium fabrum TaxID=1176649 RepID=UPI000EF57946|nr:DUF4142 domain-containing protein [Agrobacterium fabrum]AYM66002.1 membrane protein [Agrobacterium fabrum]NTE63546.1 DUF4142 domain-containing protein [Agrobacterium fabrum]